MADEQTRRELLKWWIQSGFYGHKTLESNATANTVGNGRWRNLPSSSPCPEPSPSVAHITPAMESELDADSAEVAALNEYRAQMRQWLPENAWCDEFLYLVGVGLVRLRSKVLLGNINGQPTNLSCVVEWTGPNVDIPAALSKHNQWPESWDTWSETAENWHVSRPIVMDFMDPRRVLNDIYNAANIDEAVDILQSACENGPPFETEPTWVSHVADGEGKCVFGDDIDDLRTDIAANEIVYPYGSTRLKAIANLKARAVENDTTEQQPAPKTVGPGLGQAQPTKIIAPTNEDVARVVNLVAKGMPVQTAARKVAGNSPHTAGSLKTMYYTFRRRAES